MRVRVRVFLCLSGLCVGEGGAHTKCARMCEHSSPYTDKYTHGRTRADARARKHSRNRAIGVHGCAAAAATAAVLITVHRTIAGYRSRLGGAVAAAHPAGVGERIPSVSDSDGACRPASTMPRDAHSPTHTATHTHTQPEEILP